MSGAPPRGRVYLKSGMAAVSPRARGFREMWQKFVPKRRGRPPDERAGGWSALVNGPEYEGLSAREKFRKLTWDEIIETDGDLDIAPRDFEKLADARRKAVMRWDKKHR